MCGLVFYYSIDNEAFDEDNCGIEYGTMTTICSYFGDKMTLEGRHSNLRRAGADIKSIVHISMGAKKIVPLMVPPLKDRLKGVTFLVPIPNEFIVDFVVWTAEKTFKATMNAALKTSVEGPLTNVLRTMRSFSCPLTSRALMPPPPSRESCPWLWVATWSGSS